MENDELLHKWINGNLSEAELKIFKTRPEYESLKNLYKNTEDLSVPNLEEDVMLAQILQVKKESGTTSPEAKSLFLAPWIKYAAAVSLLLFVVWYFGFPSNSLVEYNLAKAEREEGILPDQSSFVLNAESSLSYDPGNWKKNRSLNLKGEAFFKVIKGSKFKVFTDNGVVQVLGTAFNVRSRKNSLEVKCQSGKVSVLSAQGAAIAELVKGEAIRIVGDEIKEKWQMKAREGSSWTMGISRFKKVDLLTVLEELERQFDIQIDAKEINTEEIVTCNFQHEDINLALETTLKPLSIFTDFIDDKRIRLYK